MRTAWMLKIDGDVVITKEQYKRMRYQIRLSKNYLVKSDLSSFVRGLMYDRIDKILKTIRCETSSMSLIIKLSLGTDNLKYRYVKAVRNVIANTKDSVLVVPEAAYRKRCIKIIGLLEKGIDPILQDIYK